METYKKLLALSEKNKQQQKITPPKIESPQTPVLIDKQSKGPPDISSHEISKGNCIGKGTFGVVFEGKCREQPVAIKVLHEQNWDEKKLNIFKQEVEVLSQIYHPNICLFMGACFESGNMMIISELLPKGDMEKALRNKNIPLSLNQRILMARDASRGMAWLHYGDIVFIHRDLKPGNLLIDENWRVKVCDFGLTQIVKQGEKLTDGRDGAKGTPLYMAPEVLTGKPFTAAADVYSFGVILWEIFTREAPYKQFKSYVEFKDQICNHHYREKIPNECPKRFANLISSCWDGNPEARPNFADIIDTLEDVLIDITIEDPDGSLFWRKNFKGKTNVNWNDFIEKFTSFTQVKRPEEKQIEILPENPTEGEISIASRKQLNELGERSHNYFELVVKELNRRASTGEDIMDTEEDEDDYDLLLENYNNNLKCFNVVLNRGNKGLETEEINIENFGSILNYFGPITDKNTPIPFLDKVRNVLSQPWFHGDLDTREAERLLGGRSLGTYLVRFSTSAPGGFTISKVSKNNITHQRIQHTVGGFSINNNCFPTLEELINASRTELHLDQSCPGSKFNQLFESSTIDGYISNYK